MKTNIIKILSSFLLLTGVFSCNQSEIEENVEAFTKFDINYVFTYPLSFVQFNELPPPANTKIEGDFKTDPPLQQVVRTNFQVELDKNNVTSEDIRLITLEDVEISLVEPSGGNFNFLDKITLELKISPTQTKVIGELDNIKGTDKTTLLVPGSGEGFNFKQFIDREELVILMTLEANTLDTRNYIIDAKAAFEVTPCISLFEDTQDKCGGL